MHCDDAVSEVQAIGEKFEQIDQDLDKAMVSVAASEVQQRFLPSEYRTE